MGYKTERGEGWSADRETKPLIPPEWKGERGEKKVSGVEKNLGGGGSHGGSVGIQLSRRSLNPQSGRAAPGGQNLWSDTQGRRSAGWRWAGVGER